jgi:hypothetical protein
MHLPHVPTLMFFFSSENPSHHSAIHPTADPHFQLPIYPSSSRHRSSHLLPYSPPLPPQAIRRPGRQLAHPRRRFPRPARTRPSSRPRWDHAPPRSFEVRRSARVADTARTPSPPTGPCRDGEWCCDSLIL